jgi:hypothetical protein
MSIATYNAEYDGERISLHLGGTEYRLTKDEATRIVQGINQALEKMRKEYTIPNCQHEYEWCEGDMICKKCGSWHPDF